MKLKKKDAQTQEQSGFMNTRRQILNDNSGFIVQEAYKTLRTNVRFFLRGEGCQRLCITSAAASEGKSITLLNLAISIAKTGQKVVLIDADLRRPAVARLLVEKASPGLSNILAGLADTDEVLRKDIYPNLDIIFSGDIPPNPSELLGNDRMKELIETMASRYDYVLVDTPPVNVVSDACIVANLLDGALLLVRQGRSKKESVRRAVANLELTGAKVLGFVLNGVPQQKKGSYGYYYYYY